MERIKSVTLPKAGQVLVKYSLLCFQVRWQLGLFWSDLPVYLSGGEPLRQFSTVRCRRVRGLHSQHLRRQKVK